MFVYPNSNISQITSISHPIFKYVEQKFWQWIDCARHEIKDMYFSEDAIYDKKGAIIQAIENALEEAVESGKPVNLSNFDLAAAFE